ncbi:MAG TPA: type II toxin-antitoxin system VapC family toxin [Proteobacteria bacterium]|nr:type II toxin-antitoxin system VapC family toxin [Pseudomonadota bacterium]
MILCDTNVIIESFKGNDIAIAELKSIGIRNIALSAVTVMELYYGAYNKRELSRIKRDIHSIAILQINVDISGKAISLIERYSKSHNLQIPDAIIAATCLIYGIKIHTYNRRDFEYISGLKLFLP